MPSLSNSSKKTLVHQLFLARFRVVLPENRGEDDPTAKRLIAQRIPFIAIFFIAILILQAFRIPSWTTKTGSDLTQIGH